MEKLFIPVLSHFQNGNFWTASGGRMRCRAVPEADCLTAQVWEGPWSYEDSPVEEERQFPLSEEGLEALGDWLAGWQEQINARPARTLAETIQARDEFRARQAAAQAKADGR